MASMAELAYSMQMRDVIARMVGEEIQIQRPRYRYGTVESIDRPNRKCNVIYNGETGVVSVSMGAVQPSRVGQTVRIEGIGTDKFITDFYGPTVYAEAYIDRLRTGSGDVDSANLGVDGNHAAQIGPSDAINIRWDNNEFWAVNAGVRSGYGINTGPYTLACYAADGVTNDVRVTGIQGTRTDNAVRKDYADSLVAYVRAWTTVPIVGFTQVSGRNVQYCKDALGWVHMRGAMLNTNAFAKPSAAVWTFPTDYRPLTEGYWPIITSGAGFYGAIRITGGGVMTVDFFTGTAAASSTWTLDSVHFYAGQT